MFFALILQEPFFVSFQDQFVHFNVGALLFKEVHYLQQLSMEPPQNDGGLLGLQKRE